MLMNTSENKIIVSALVLADPKKTWDCYTLPEHIVNWNFASDDWHCPSAKNDMRIGGIYNARMEAKDGSFGFNFEATYTEIVPGIKFSYEFGGRIASVHFQPSNSNTEVRVEFDPENENSLELQKKGWQAILDNFKKYTESSRER